MREQKGEAAAIWTLAVIVIVEVTTVMVFMVPKVYYEIKEKGKREGIVKGRAAVLAAMREAGVDEETRRRVEYALARRARRNGL